MPIQAEANEKDKKKFQNIEHLKWIKLNYVTLISGEQSTSKMKQFWEFPSANKESDATP